MLFGRHDRPEGERLPWGYGVAYWRPDVDASVCYPIPFNWIVRWIRQLVIWLAHPSASWEEKYHWTSMVLDAERLHTYELRQKLLDMENREYKRARCLCIRETGRCDCFNECRCNNCID